jgi:PD-(D/E)XK nuclease superfamily protein
MRWSFSSSRTFTRCPRQFYYGQIAASHSAKKDPLRREAFLLKQRKSLPLWRGNLVHDAIETLVIPAWREHRHPNWDVIVSTMRETAARQLEFSAAGRYRETGMTKTKAGDAYCALVGHGPGEVLSEDGIASALEEAERALRNLAGMTDLHDQIAAAPRPLFAELRVPVTYDGVSINAQIDLLYFRRFAQPTIVEWKTYEGTVGNSELQGALYAWALQQHPKWRIKSPDVVEILEVQLLKSTVIPHQVSADSLLALEDTIYRSVCDIRSVAGDGKYANVDIADFPITKNPKNCEYCPFQMLCADRLQAANDDTINDYRLAVNG